MLHDRQQHVDKVPDPRNVVLDMQTAEEEMRPATARLYAERNCLKATVGIDEESTTVSRITGAHPSRPEPAVEAILDALTLEDMKMDFTTLYLDHHSRALFHTAMSLSTYFLAHNVWDVLAGRMDAAVHAVQADITALAVSAATPPADPVIRERCMALESQEQAFCDLFEAAGSLQAFGGPGITLRIMQNVRKIRKT
ncbi:hypothetical protein CMQ_5384 [Grosmannia clavigera kw1407]|uniref:Uncharacterized protein n=1 Tax=Grosmannia clavigera (strain kw1407 / UAMH 11150) TaxID=655863 RepID=F0XBE7_GROCL|nr:uncharacterized protein CMQ_5384 [Grosmannia clavigera kw1407]EFX05122.1 hypothetical protein CMQ_5384 [Grosmannia clavigera kw1407]